MQLHQKFIEVAKANLKKIAVHDIATEKDITYEKMLIVSLILAKKISKFKSKYIGIMVPTSAGCMLSVIGSLMAGKVPAMINYSTGARENAKYAQEKCSFKTIITSRKLLEKIKVKPIDGMIFLEDIVASLSLLDKLPALFKSKLPTNVLTKKVHASSIEDEAVILFTSGSEKEPKAVQLSHKNITHNLETLPATVGLTKEDIFLSNLPLFHVFGTTANFWLPLTMGATSVTYPNPLDYKIVCRLVKEYNITVMAGTPAFYHGYLKKSRKGDFSSIRYALSGADILTKQLYDGFLEKHELTLHNAYGTTETSPAITISTPEDNKFGSVGKALNGVQIEIRDRETDATLEVGSVGKIYVKGDNVMTGYLGDLEETSRSIHNGWYDTGDMGMIDEDGFLWHKGRLKRFVKVAGEMVSLVRVEETLTEILPEGVVCCVVDVPNPTKGADVVAAVTTGEFDKKKVIKQLKKDLPAIAIPKEFHIIEDIPMMGSGKVNFREVEKICRKRQAAK